MTNTLKAHCPRCDDERNCLIHGAIDVPWAWEDGQHSVDGRDGHKLLQCQGFDTVFYQLSSQNSEDWDGRYDPGSGEEEIFHPVRITTFPAPEKSGGKPDWVWSLQKIDPQLAVIMDEMYEASDAGLLILASIGLRTAFDRATEVLKIDPGMPLARKVDKLLAEGFVGETEAKTLGVVTEAGSAAAHRGWAPEQAEFKTLLETLEQFILHAIVNGKAALGIAPKIPAKAPRPPPAK